MSKDSQTREEPYSNMSARFGVLVAGFVMSILSFVLVLMSYLFLFVPSINFVSHVSPSVLLKWLLVVGIILGFIGTVFAVAGANSAKPMARLSFFFSTMSFITGAALLVIILLFRTLLPIDAIERMSAFMI